MTTELNIRLVIVLIILHSLSLCLLNHQHLPELTIKKSAVTGACWQEIVYAKLLSTPKCPNLPVSKLSHNKFCHILWSYLLCVSVCRYLLITVAITTLPHHQHLLQNYVNLMDGATYLRLTTSSVTEQQCMYMFTDHKYMFLCCFSPQH